jgi:hypothetical protein
MAISVPSSRSIAKKSTIVGVYALVICVRLEILSDALDVKVGQRECSFGAHQCSDLSVINTGRPDACLWRTHLEPFDDFIYSSM